MDRHVGAFADQVPAVLVGIAVLSITLVGARYLGYRSLNRFPLIGSQYGSYPKRLMAYVYHAETLYREGYAKFRSAAYRMTTADGERIILPNTYLDELRTRPDDEVNNTKAIFMTIEGKYTGLTAEGDFLNHMVRADLTRNLPRVNPRLSEEVDRSVKTELPLCDDWTPVAINQRLLRIVAIVSGHIFLGPELYRREEYLHASIDFTVDVFAAVRALKRWPKILRPIAARFFTPQLDRVKDHRVKAKEFLVPIIQQRKAMMKQGAEMPDDMLQWMLDKSDSHNVKDDAEMAFMQLTLSMAAIHTTSMTATHILYDIVAHPEVIPDLREEIKSVLEETDGVMTTQALFRMKLLDSVMRESQRVNPLNMARFARYIEKPITLHDGTNIPAGVVVEAPHVAISHDPELYPNPETFDPYRFYRLRSGETADPIGYKSTEQYQFVTVTKENMGFGYGRHACPGRFFAANEIKLILARLLLDFDFKMPEGETKRFDNIVVASSIIPDARKEIMLRRVTP